MNSNISVGVGSKLQFWPALSPWTTSLVRKNSCALSNTVSKITSVIFSKMCRKGMKYEEKVSACILDKRCFHKINCFQASKKFLYSIWCRYIVAMWRYGFCRGIFLYMKLLWLQIHWHSSIGRCFDKGGLCKCNKVPSRVFYGNVRVSRSIPISLAYPAFDCYSLHTSCELSSCLLCKHHSCSLPQCLAFTYLVLCWSWL